MEIEITSSYWGFQLQQKTIKPRNIKQNKSILKTTSSWSSSCSIATLFIKMYTNDFLKSLRVIEEKLQRKVSERQQK